MMLVRMMNEWTPKTMSRSKFGDSALSVRGECIAILVALSEGIFLFLNKKPRLDSEGMRDIAEVGVPQRGSHGRNHVRVKSKRQWGN